MNLNVKSGKGSVISKVGVRRGNKKQIKILIIKR